MAQEWNETELWKRITAFTGDDEGKMAAQTLCNGWMAGIAQVLTLNSGLLPDFTLHDAKHSFRVAEAMAKIIPADTVLAVQELALLLLAAYLHDIGMVPDQSRIDAVRGFLRGRPTGKHTDETALLARWLDDFSPETNLPVTQDTLPEGEESEDRWVNFLVQHFCRRRHCDWASVWIEEHKPAVGLYPGWHDDLKDLCHSHHWGRDELENLALVRVPGSLPDAKVNLRYLALVLRIADVLDAHPDRVPEIIYESRGIAVPSRVFWDKDRTVNVSITSNTVSAHRVVNFQATPGNAKSHHACLETARQISTELALAGTLMNENWHALGDPAETTRCTWTLPHGVTTEVKARNQAYHFIDGAFRPDTRRVLQILSGLELYQNTMAAVRELIQNAFDAVRFAIAKDMLAEAERLGAEFQPETVRLDMGARYHIDLTLKEEDGHWWLICRDDGTGMSKAIIEGRLLVSGAGHGHRERELDRQCRDKGFSPEITGKFGIGVLSYFMLADMVRIRTCPGQCAPEAKGQGWEFTSEGVGTFGELKSWPSDFHRTGTEVGLRLRPKELGTDTESWFGELVAYVNAMLVRVPAHVTVKMEKRPAALSLKPGWTWDLERHREWLRGQGEEFVGSHSYHSGPSTPYEDDDDDGEAIRLFGDQVAAAAAEALTILRTEEGMLEGGLGRYRLQIPAYNTPHGPCPLYLFVLSPKKKDMGCTPMFERRAWKGIKVAIGDFHTDQMATIVLDLFDKECGVLPASRNSLEPSDKLKSALDQLDARARQLWLDALQEIPTALREIGATLWASENDNFLDHLPSVAADSLWPQAGNLHSIPLPQIGRSGVAAGLWRSLPVIALQSINRPQASSLDLSDSCAPSAVAWHDNERIVPVWAHPLQRPSLVLNGGGGIFAAVEFPPEWSHIALCNRFINAEGPFQSFLDQASFLWLSEALAPEQDPVPILNDLINDPRRAAAWLIGAFSDVHDQIFDKLRDKRPKVIRNLWDSTFGPNAPPVVIGKTGSIMSGIGLRDKTHLRSFHPNTGWVDIGPLPRPADAKWRIEPVETTKGRKTTPKDLSDKR